MTTDQYSDLRLRCLMYEEYITNLINEYNNLAIVFNHPTIIKTARDLNFETFKAKFFNELKKGGSSCR